MASKLEELQNQSSPEALRILALGGDPSQSQAVRSNAFLRGMAGTQGFHADELRPGSAEFTRRVNQGAERAQDSLEGSFEARGLGTSGLLERGILDIEQQRKDALAPKPVSNIAIGDGSDTIPQILPLPRGGGPGGPRPTSAPNFKVDGISSDLGLKLPDIEMPDVDEDALRNALAQEQRKFNTLNQRGSLSVGAGPLAARQAGQRDLNANESAFGTLGQNRSAARKPGESLSDFVNRDQRFNSDPNSMSRGELAGTTLQAFAQIRGGKRALTNLFSDIQAEFHQAAQSDLAALTTLPQMIQTIGQETVEDDSGHGPKIRRPLNAEEQQERHQFLLNAMRGAAQRVQAAQEQAMEKARQAQARIMQNIAIAQNRVKKFASALDQQSALKVRAGRAAAASRYDELDKTLYQRLSRRFGKDPNEINTTTGLPNWQHLRTNVSQEEAQKAMMRFRQVGAGGLADPRQEFTRLIGDREQARQQALMDQQTRRAQAMADAARSTQAKNNAPIIQAQRGVSRGQRTLSGSLGGSFRSNNGNAFRDRPF